MVLVYDLLRDTWLNIKYYSCKLERIERLNKFLEILLAIAAPSSGLAIADLVYFQQGIGQHVWQIFTAITAILAIAQPKLGHAEKIGKLKELIVGYRDLEHDITKIIVSVKERGQYDDELKKFFWLSMDKWGTLKNRSLDGEIDKKLQDKFTEEVIKEFPAESFYIPNDQTIEN